MVQDFEDWAEEKGRRSTVKEVFRFAEKLGVELILKHPYTVKTELRECQVQRPEEEVRN